MKELKVNIGGGFQKLDGFVSVDNDPLCKPDKCFDVNGKWDFESDSVDFVNCDYTIEHIHNLNNFADELYRVLKRGGKARISTCNFYFWRARLSYLFGDFTRESAFCVYHCWLFKPSQLAAIFRTRDMRVEIKGHGLLPFPDLFYYNFVLEIRKLGGKQ